MESLRGEAIFDPFRSREERAALTRSVVELCGYGCGAAYRAKRGTLFRGHVTCLGDLGKDLLLLVEVFPRLTYARLAADLGITLRALRQILDVAIAARDSEALDRTEQILGVRRTCAPRELSPRSLECLAFAAAVWSAQGRLPGIRDVEAAMSINPSSAGNHLHTLRWKGWITKETLLHVPDCAKGCRPGTCPTMAPPARLERVA